MKSVAADNSKYPLVKLGGVASIVAGQSPPGDTYRKTPGGLPFFQGKADFGPLHPEPRVWCTHPNKIAEQGDILISVRAPVGPTNIAASTCCIGRGLAAIRPGRHLDTGFLLRWLQWKEPDLAALGSGSTFQSISRQHLEALEIPLPPLSEQKRVAGLIQEQLAAVERARTAAEAQLAAARALPAAFLRAVFGSQTAGEGAGAPLGALLARPLRTGISKPPNPNSPHRCLTLSSVRNGLLDLSASKGVAVTPSDAEGCWVQPGGFYVVRGNGNRALVARGGLAPEHIDSPVLYPDLLIQVITDPSRILPSYLRWVWETPEVRKQLEEKSQTSAGIYKINQANLAEIRLPLPPLPVQDRLARDCQRQMDQYAEVNARILVQLEALQVLPAQLLRAAFSGAL